MSDGGIRKRSQGWAEAEVERLLRLKGEGKSSSEIASDMGRTRNQVVAKLWRMGSGGGHYSLSGERAANWRGGMEASRERYRDRRRKGGPLFRPYVPKRPRKPVENRGSDAVRLKIGQKLGPICAGLRGYTR